MAVKLMSRDPSNPRSFTVDTGYSFDGSTYIASTVGGYDYQLGIFFDQSDNVESITYINAVHPGYYDNSGSWHTLSSNNGTINVSELNDFDYSKGIFFGDSINASYTTAQPTSTSIPKIGSNDVLKIYFGNGEVQKIYLGNELVYDNSGGSGDITFEENAVLTNSLGLPLYPQSDYDEFSMPNNLEIPTVNWQENEDTGEGEVIDVTKTIPSSQIGMDLVSIYDLGASVGSTYYIPTFYTNQIGYSNPYFVYGGLYNSMQDALDALDTGINLSYPEISTALTREHCAIIFKVTWLGYDDPTGVCCFTNAYLQS